jgi:hypothetical protein
MVAKLERVALREALPQRVVECAALEMRLRCKPIGGSNPSLSASKSMILYEKMLMAQLCRHFRGLAPSVARVGHWERKFLTCCTFSVGRFSERDFASGFLCE